MAKNLSEIEKKLGDIGDELRQLRKKKPHKIQNTLLIIQTFMLAVMVLTLLILILEKQPEVIPSYVTCPKTTGIFGSVIPASYGSYGGSGTTYKSSLEVENSKCFIDKEDEINIMDGSIVKVWNRVHNQTNCSATYYIGKDKRSKIRFVVFHDTDIEVPKKVSYKFYYQYKKLLGWSIKQLHQECIYLKDDSKRVLILNSTYR